VAGTETLGAAFGLLELEPAWGGAARTEHGDTDRTRLDTAQDPGDRAAVDGRGRLS